MQLKNYKFIIHLVIISFLIQCATTSNSYTGKKGYIESVGEGSSESDALERAKANAIKAKIGEQITGKNKVVNAELDSSSVMSFFQGFVYDVKVLKKEVNSGTYKLFISCMVDDRDLNQYIENVLITKSRPRVMMLVQENKLKETFTPDSSKQSSTEAAMISYLNSLGFGFVQKSDNVIKLLKQQKGNLTLAIQGNATIAKEIGSELGAELVVLGDVKAEGRESTGGNLKSIQAIASLKIVDVGTGSIVASQETYGADASSNEGFAASNAIKYAIEEALNGTPNRVGMIRQMLKKWNPGNGNEFQLSIQVKEFEMLNDFISAIEKVDDRIISVNSKGFKSGNSSVVIFYRGSANELLNSIIKDSDIKKNFKPKVTNQTSSQIFLKIGN